MKVCIDAISNIDRIIFINAKNKKKVFRILFYSEKNVD